MGRSYDAALLDVLREGTQETVKDGVPILVKPIPEEGADGDMDPRLAKSMRFLPLLRRFMPKPKANATVAEKSGVMSQGGDLMREIAAMMREVL